MKLTMVLFIATTMQVSATDFAQKITIKKNDISLETPLNEFLRKSFGNQALSYGAENRTIIIAKLKKTLINSNTGLYSAIDVSGRVVDSEGNPLPGASVKVKNTTKAVITGADGGFQLKGVDEGAVLEVSFIGYVSEEIKVKKDLGSIVLKTADSRLEEIVVVAYGTQKKVNLTGAVSVINSEALKNRPITNLGQGLQGLIPNLNIKFSDGAAGASASFNVRGFTSTNGGGPLVLVDGVEMNPNLLNPSEVESVSVLKDASAAAVYGSRAAFGVVLITTKSAKKGQKLNVSYSTNYSLNKPTEIPDLVDSRENIQFREEKAKNLGEGPPFDAKTKALLLAHYNDPANNPSAIINPNDPTKYLYFANTDWFDAIFKKTSPMRSNNVSLSGSNKDISYYLSAGLLGQDGILKYGNDSYSRSNIRGKMDIEATNWLKFDVNTVLTSTRQDNVYTYSGVGTLWHDLTRKSPFLPLFNPDGTNTESPLALLKDGGRDKRAATDSWITLGTTLKPFEGFQVRGSYSYNSFYNERKQHKKKVERYEGPSELSASSTVHTTPTGVFLDNTRNDYYAINVHGEYEKKFLEKHYLKATLGYNEERKRFHFTSSSNQNLLTDELPSLNLTTGTPVASERSTAWALQGYFYRLNYIFMDRYLFEFNGRYDATSRFPKADRWGFFPSVSAGWRVSQEPFFQALKPIVSEFKIRGSYGELGNQSVNDETSNSLNFSYLPTLGSFRPGAILGSDRPLSVRNPLLVSSTLTWETAISSNIGVDAEMFASRLRFSFDYFQRRVKDQLGPGLAIPATLGTGAPRANAVESVTKGWELEASWRHKVGEVNYNLGFNIGDSQAEITKYNNPTKSLSAAFYEGQKIGEIWGFKTNGLFESNAQYKSSGLNYSNRTGLPIAGGDVWYRDQDGNGIIDRGTGTVNNPGDLVVIGNNTPRYTFGINLGAEWKGFSIDVFMQGVGKRDMALYGGLFWPDESGTPQINHLNYWTEINKGGYWPRVLGSQGGFNYENSDRYLQNFAYLRMKQLTLSYSLPSTLLEKTLFRSASIYFTGQNLFEKDKIISGFDPEISSDGFNGWGPGKSYPFQRSYSIGLNITF
ncbi:SusC/RagA family TonB-linked outer membrane protein [Pedobacter ginsengisoli]|uniref:SusC/RagA family TonB-linked outer membrane protein n=1 Tax=Pedobacter ginsengisoli TaxID=363852 RepID=UPI00254D910A|nr:TonB-dependent receptor [Pedobacter ginsengisoli]